MNINNSQVWNKISLYKNALYVFKAVKIYLLICILLWLKQNIRDVICVRLFTHTSNHHTTHQCLGDFPSLRLHVQTHCPAHLNDAVIYIFLIPPFFTLGAMLACFYARQTMNIVFCCHCRAVLRSCTRSYRYSRLSLKFPPHASVFDVLYRSAMTHCL